MCHMVLSQLYSEVTWSPPPRSGLLVSFQLQVNSTLRSFHAPQNISYQINISFNERPALVRLEKGLRFKKNI